MGSMSQVLQVQRLPLVVSQTPASLTWLPHLREQEPFLTAILAQVPRRTAVVIWST